MQILHRDVRNIIKVHRQSTFVVVYEYQAHALRKLVTITLRSAQVRDIEISNNWWRGHSLIVRPFLRAINHSIPRYFLARILFPILFPHRSYPNQSPPLLELAPPVWCRLDLCSRFRLLYPTHPTSHGCYSIALPFQIFSFFRFD